jgi:SP family general alpha glucoside:H+ symporter-like MFS transporter
VEPWCQGWLRLGRRWIPLGKFDASTSLGWPLTNSTQTIWIFFRLPEPKGRTYGELDILFEQKTPARQFASTHVDEFDAHERDAAAAVMGAGVVH